MTTSPVLGVINDMIVPGTVRTPTKGDFPVVGVITDHFTCAWCYQ